ncbi:MAG TPA: minor capsid protein [Labilithrix sp.]|nr:minor capsid protein [Labilithrix sp.]
MRRIARRIEEAILETVEPHVERFAKPEPEPEPKSDARVDAPPPYDEDPRGVIESVRDMVQGILDDYLGETDKASAVAGERAVKHSQREFERLGIKLLKEEPSFKRRIKAWRKENVDRIVSLSKAKVDRVEVLLKNKAGMRVETLRKSIQESVGATKSQASLIARDQVLKLNGQITEARQVAAGITEYIWCTSNDSRVRGRPDGLYPDAHPSHWALEGKRFRWDKPPISGPRGERGHPGSMFQCRCVAYGILPELEAEGLG